MNPYKVLGIRPNASLDEIKTAYESLANTYDISNYQAYNSLINEYKYKDIRDLIENQQFLSAETQLNLISDKSSAEWNYLEGFVLLKKGWFKAGVNHVKIAAELNPENEEYQEALMVLAKKVKQMKTNYARTMQNNTAANNNNMCGGTGSNQANMCGGQNSGGGIDPNILNMLMNSGANMGGAKWRWKRNEYVW